MPPPSTLIVPPAGSQPSSTANRMISNSPSQKAGTEKPTKASRFDRPIEHAPRPRCRPHPGRQRDGECEDEARAHQQERVAQPPAQHVDRRHGVEPRVAEIALRRPP